MSASEPTVVIVTGASGNLGRAVVRRLAGDGCRVVEIDRSSVRLAKETLATVDFAQPASTRAAFERVAQRLGRLDAVVHTVGTYRGGQSLVDTAPDEFNALFAINVMTTVNMLSAALPIMLAQGSGSIAAVVSASADAGSAKNAAYSASKAAQLRVIESAAQEVAERGLRINAVLPGTMDTPENRSAMPKADPRRWLSLDAVADVLAYLISPAAAAVNRQGIRLRPEA